jgi:hypothetical protein
MQISQIKNRPVLAQHLGENTYQYAGSIHFHAAYRPKKAKEILLKVNESGAATK